MDAERCLRVGYGHWPPFSMYTGDGLAGIMGTVLDVLAYKLNFCYELVPIGPGGWGTILANGTWTGLMGMCHRGEVDIALGPLAINEERAAAVDMSVPLFYDQQVISYSRPKLEPDLAGFIRPFTPLMWLINGLVVILVFIATCILLVTPSSWKSHRGSGSSSGLTRGLAVDWSVRETGPAGTWQRVYQLMLWTFGVLLNQSMAWFPSNNTGRVLGGFWLMAALIIATVYRSNLKAMIIIPKVNVPFNNLEELIEQSEIPYIVIGGGAVYSTFKAAARDSLFGRAWSNLAQAAWTYQEGLRLILYEGHAIIIDHTTILNVLHGSFSKVTFMSIREHGLINHWMHEELMNSTHCLTPPGSEPIEQRSLQLQDFYGVFILFGFGLVLSLLVFLLELVWDRLCNHHEGLSQSTTRTQPTTAPRLLTSD
ncbi:Glutamate receptor ionotropic, kainate 3-like 3 [Homarus americanus]|uniref:Glutamate receptor ionotropic, kainate 3-like 3 n=1 Tax=Homarus americanus TaxID=6706 RepID=A0A8J5MS68_HOMAM|nr:Glutamate receptor ionotropic, kainate 3-like 3 [Homarus americanus]